MANKCKCEGTEITIKNNRPYCEKCKTFLDKIDPDDMDFGDDEDIEREQSLAG